MANVSYTPIFHNNQQTFTPTIQESSDFLASFSEKENGYNTVFKEYEYTFTPLVRETSAFAVSFSEHKNIESVSYYQNSNYGNVVPSGEWTTNPHPEPGKYLWVKTIINFTDGSSSTIYSIGYIGVNGQGSVNSVNGMGGDVVLDGRNIYIDNSASSPCTIVQKFQAIENDAITNEQIDALFV